jgi:hypothetical protein
LEFAKNLDFDKYIDDMEIQTMMEQVRNRIEALEKMNDEEFEAKEGEFRQVHLCLSLSLSLSRSRTG